MIADNGAPLDLSPAAVEAAREAGRAARERAASNGAEDQAVTGTPPTPEAPAAPTRPAGVPRGGPAPPKSKAEPCGPCEDGLTLGIPRPTERALGLVGIGVGIVLVLMGIDLASGGALSRLAGLSGSDDGGDRGPR